MDNFGIPLGQNVSEGGIPRSERVPWQQRTGQEFLDERVVHLAATRANDAAKAAAKAEKKDVVDRLREKVAASKKDVTETNVKLRETRAREKLAENKLQVANREIARLTVALKSVEVGAEVAVSEIARKKTKKRNERPENSAPKPHKDDFLDVKCSHDGCTIHGWGLIKDDSFCRCCWKKWYCRHHVRDLEDHRHACEAAKSLPNSPVRKKLVADRGTTNN